MYIKLLLFYVIIITTVTSEHHSNQTIPLSLIKQLNNVNTIEEFTKFLDNKDTFGEFTGRKSAILKTQPASCTPAIQTIKLRSSKSDDPNYFVFPTCTRVEQCGGCCSSPLMSCQPVETEILTFEVLVSEYSGGQLLTVKDIELVSVEKHTKCRCACKVKPEDCNALQTYVKEDCQCECTNNEERVYCQWNDLKIWDAKTCECRCLTDENCTIGSTFDQNTCTCVKN